MKIKKGDTVHILTGKDRGKRGAVERVNKADGTVVVAGVGAYVRHMKPRPQARITGGRVEMQRPIHISNVALVDTKTGRYTKSASQVLKNGERERVNRKTRDAI